MRVYLSLLYLALFCGAASCFNLSFNQFMESTPTTFGLITVTHARNGVYSYFRKHLDSYAEMDCPEISEISVVWNNDVTPESVGFTPSETWKRPVHFIKTPYNSMDFRYMLPKESTAQVFFSIDDDVIITCQQLRKSFQVWRSKAIGDIGPLVSYGIRGFSFNSTTQEIVYVALRRKYFSIALTGVGWISRFFFQLYNSQKGWEVNSLREFVREKNNCDDLALNFVVSYYFPQLIVLPVDGKHSMKNYPGSQAQTSTHYSFRNTCLKTFSQILGYNPLRIINRYDYTNRTTSLLTQYTVYMKRKFLSQKLVEDIQFSNETTFDEFIGAKSIGDENSLKIGGKVANSSQDQEVSRLKYELGKMRQENEQLLKKNVQMQLILKQKQQLLSNPTQTQSPNPQTDQALKIESLTSQIDLVLKICIFMAVIMSCVGVYMVQGWLKKQKYTSIKQAKVDRDGENNESATIVGL